MTYSNRSRLAFASILLTAVLAAVVAFVGAPSARAGSEACAPTCVILLEIDGLEAKDVTPQTTPFLWALAHPDAVPSATVPKDEADPLSEAPSLQGRNGWIWQAARGVMSTSTAASTTALLTGGYPEQDGVLADAYKDGGAEKIFGDDLMGGSNGIESSTDMLTHLVSDQTDGKVAAIVGDPYLTSSFLNLDSDTDLWAPQKTDSVPAYCRIPPDADTWNNADTGPQNANWACPTVDMNTADNAYKRLNDPTLGAKVSFAYIYFAELGAIKRLYGDTDGQPLPSDPTSDTDRAVSAQLAQTDAAVAYFVNRYAQDQKQKWDNTVMFVVGNHGYESSPISNRVPDAGSSNPVPADPGAGLASLVKRASLSTATVSLQGSLATVYDSNQDPSHLGQIRNAILGINDAQQCQPPAGPCIQEVLYTGTDPEHPDDPAKAQTVQDRHPSWHLHSVDKDGKPTGADGQLIVVMSPRWSVGQAIPASTDPSQATNTYSASGERIENQYNGVAGGPRDRAIAAIVNGNSSTVRQVDLTNGSGRYPVAPATAPMDDQKCEENKTPAPADPSTDAYWNQNINPGDDANLPGHECQAETVDFAPTIAALLHVSVPDRQLAGRFLQEAFQHPLAFPKEDEVLPPPDVDETPPLPEPDIYIPPPPPPPVGFDFTGLYRNLKATVVDQDGCDWTRARPGSKLDFLKIEGDFGRPHAAVTLTFYQRDATASSKRGAQAAAHVRAYPAANRKSRCQAKAAPSRASATKPGDLRTQLKAIAHFKPFKLDRGHVVLRLKVPDQFLPTHVGIIVREARTLSKPGPDGLKFQAFGPMRGTITAIGDGSKLHAVKPAKTKAKRQTANGR